MTSSLLDVLYIAACGGLGSILVWVFIGPYVSGRGLMGFVKRAQSPGTAQEVLYVLFDVMLLWATTHKVSTGKRCKIRQDTGDVDDAGNPIYVDVEVDESLTPLDMLINRMSKAMLAKLSSSAGGIKGQLGAALGGKRKGQSTVDYAVEQLMQRAAPLIDQRISDKLKPPMSEYVHP